MKAAPLADHAALTKKQALYRDRPIWAASKNISVITRKSPLRKTYDVIIVGAGISGALMAHALAGKGLRLFVVDRRVPVTGSSLASTSMIMHEIDVPLHVLAKSEGEDVSRRVWQRSARAVSKVTRQQTSESDFDLGSCQQAEPCAANLLDNHLVWEASDPYLYFRSMAGRVIVGGEDEKGEEAYKNPMKAKEKTSVLVEKIGDLTGISFGKPDFVWSAAFAVTSNGLPMIGKVPGMKNVFVAMGYGGNGITFSQIAADIISSEIVGRRDPDWNLFPVV